MALLYCAIVNESSSTAYKSHKSPATYTWLGVEVPKIRRPFQKGHPKHSVRFFTFPDNMPSSELCSRREIASLALVFQVHGHNAHQANTHQQCGKLFDRFTWFAFTQQIWQHRDQGDV